MNTMRQFDEQIKRLKQELSMPFSLLSPSDKESLTNQIKTLMELDGWEPGHLAERVTSLEGDFERLENALKLIHASLVERDMMGNKDIGFGERNLS